MSQAQAFQADPPDQTDQADPPDQTDQADQADPPELDPESAWLAAFALGLAYSRRSHRERLELLREATRGQPQLLAVAQQRLETVQVVEPELRDQARQLLNRALTASVTGATWVTANGE